MFELGADGIAMGAIELIVILAFLLVLIKTKKQ